MFRSSPDIEMRVLMFCMKLLSFYAWSLLKLKFRSFCDIHLYHNNDGLVVSGVQIFSWLNNTYPYTYTYPYLFFIFKLFGKNENIAIDIKKLNFAFYWNLFSLLLFAI